MIAFLDASALIYLLEGEPPWASAVKHELQALADGHPQLAIALSRLSVLECRAGPLRRGDQSSLERFDGFFARSDLLWQELSPAVVEQAATLRAQHGLRTSDALQAACCLQLGQDAVMLSGDGDFERIEGLRLRLIR